jgi:hypothetical protein
MKYYINVKNPCSEKWDSMRDDNHQKFCERCQKKVTDLTQLSDLALLDFLKDNSTVCGRIKVSQVNRKLQIPKKPLPFGKIAATIGLTTTIAINQPMTAQEPQKAEIIDSKEQKHNSSVEKTSQEFKTIQGNVKDEQGIPLPGVHVSTSKQISFTDFDGNFSIKTPKNTSSEKTVIIFEFTGYFKVEKYLDETETNISVILKEDPKVLQEYIVLGGIRLERKK